MIKKKYESIIKTTKSEIETKTAYQIKGFSEQKQKAAVRLYLFNCWVHAFFKKKL